MSREWFSKQEPKNEKHRENIKKIREEIHMKNMKRKLTVSVDAGKGYTKWAYEKLVEGTDKNGNKVVRPKWITGIELSSVEVGKEAEIGTTTYITTNGVEKKYNFFGTTKAVENNDKSKDNEEHRALMQRTLFKIALEEDVTDFELIMCMSLDQYKVKENIEKMRKTMFVKEFTVKEMVKDKKTKNEEEVEKTIRIHNVVIEPETLVTTRFANVKFKDVNAILVDIGTLNVGIAPIEEGRVNVANITAPRIGYYHMISKLKEYCNSHDEKKTEYPEKMLDIYVRKEQGNDENLDKLIREFFINDYSVELKKEIDKKGYGRFATLVFLGGTSIDCEEHIRASFTEYKNVEIITDIFATVKGAYKKGVKDLEKMQAETLV